MPSPPSPAAPSPASAAAPDAAPDAIPDAIPDAPFATIPATIPATAPVPTAHAAAGGGRVRTVGIGASAGGLAAIEDLLRALPGDSGLAYVVVQHLDPTHTSLLDELLQRATPMPVAVVDEGRVVEADHVYVIPPGQALRVAAGRLRLGPQASTPGRRATIDTLLCSLASDLGPLGAGVILSGSGRDGTLGLQALERAGGLCLVQDPATALHDAMPLSAIEAGGRLQVLAPAALAQALLAWAGDALPAVAGAGPAVADPDGSLPRILALLRSGTGHDFSHYKQSTVARRVIRRMQGRGLDRLADYANRLQDDPIERTALLHELLINVTAFFRDPAAFEQLRRQVLQPLLERPRGGQPLRIWVAGCASGEEAYSIAMVLCEAMDEHPVEVPVQFYATDLDDDAITYARAGLYPMEVAQTLGADRVRRFFTPEDGGLRIKKAIRERVVFAVQSVIKDPPFTRLDLLVCRNLMIYLEAPLQERLIATFHYALRPGGALFLSPSEGTGAHGELFEPIDRKWKLYRARHDPGAARTARALLGSSLAWPEARGTPAGAEPAPRPRPADLGEWTRRALLQAYAPASVVTDAQGQVLHVHGETGRYLRPPPGVPTHQLVDMACEGLHAELHDALARALQQQPTLDRPVLLPGRLNGATAGAIAGAIAGPGSGHLALSPAGAEEAHVVRLSVRALPHPDHGQLLLVSFDGRPVDLPAAGGPRARRKRSGEALRIAALQQALALAQAHITAMLEAQQAAHEELKSTNEELQSINEELQSTNEELETSKEELQSVNEELVTVNAELQTRIEQMGLMQDDMKNLLDNIRVGTIFLDRQLHIRRYTRDATRLYRLVPTDVGRPLADIRSAFDGPDLLPDAQRVLDTLVPVERELGSGDGLWHLARIQPYRTVDNVIDGVVLTFADVTERVQANHATRKARDLAEAIVDTVHDALLVLDARLQVISANRAFHAAFGTTEADTEGRALLEIGQRRWDQPVLRELLATVAAQPPGVERRATLHALPGLEGRMLLLSARRMVEQAGSDEHVLLAIETVAMPAPAPA